MVIKDKYLPSTTVENWLFSTPTLPRKVSQTWRSLNKSTYLIRDWINWHPGSGRSISLGSDHILGLGLASFLSPNLLAQLHNKGLFYIHHASSHNQLGTPFAGWISGYTLELTGDSLTEWNKFCRSLISAGVYLHNNKDRLLWTGGDSSGHITVSNLYSTFINSANSPNITGWRKGIWKWKIPLKLKIFTWLVDKNKISTWDNLLRKGWNGPNICQLCKKDEETIPHIFIHCEFARKVWNKISIVRLSTSTWQGTSIVDCFVNWFSSERAHKLLPPMVI
jgi:hypothetical protein